MYLDIGQATVVRGGDIVGVFDLDNASWSHRTREFLDKAERRGEVKSVCADLPRSFVLCREGEDTRLYLSQFSSATLKGRAEEGSL